MINHPGVRLVQLGTTSLGFDCKGADGWFGPNTAKATSALLWQGPAKWSEWAIQTLQRGLRDLGYLPASEATGEWDTFTWAALEDLVDAEGAPRAAAADPGEVLEPTKPLLPPASHSSVIRQGSAGYVIDTICLHCAAVPGYWARDKTNAEIAAAIHKMHTDPVSRGGRGWSDTGYHAITCPDGEILSARPINVIGAGAVGYNRGVYHLLMIEVVTIDRMATVERWFTPATLASAKAQVECISRNTPIRRLMGHNEVAAKLCPGGPIIDREWTDRAVA